MKQLVIMVSVILIIFSCVSTKETGKENMLLGNWCLESVKQLNYPIITFKADSIAIFSSKMDTVYSFKYYQKDDFLNIVQSNNDIIKAKINFISKDSLVFETLLENNFKQIYHKCN